MGEVESRLAAIEANQVRTLTLLEGLSAKVDERVEHSDRWRGTVDGALYGSGSKDPGMIVRMDRLEQAHDRSRWITRAIVGAVITIGVGSIWRMLH